MNREIIDYNPKASFLIQKATYRIAYLNEKAALLLNQDKQEVIGSSFKQKISKEYLTKGVYDNVSFKIDEDSFLEGDLFVDDYTAENVEYLIFTFLDYKFRFSDHYAAFFEFAPDGIIITNSKLTVIAINPAFEKISGLTKEQVEGKGAFKLTKEFAPKETVASLMNIIKTSLLGRSVQQFEVSYKGKTLSFSSNIKFGSRFNIGMLRDISEHKRNLQHAIESDNKYKKLVDSSRDGICILQNGLIKYVNPIAVQLSKYKEEELIGQDFFQFVNESDRDKFRGNYLNREKGKIVSNFYESSIQIGDGEYVYVEITIIPIQLEGEDAQQVVISDMTDHKKSQHVLLQKNQELEITKEKAVESDRLKSAFLANVSHEIRTPMNGIIGFTSILKENILPRDKQLDYLDVIQKSGFRMLTTINDLMDISKIESGEVKVRKKSVDINALMRELHEFFILECEQKDIRLSIVNQDYNLPFIIEVDFDKTNAILTNLIKNAIKFTDSGEITFGYQLRTSLLKFSVMDTGIGIAEEKQDHIFDRFVQAELQDTRNFEGTGLGLSISKSYVEMMGGEIWLESTLNKGSIFYFSLPY